MEEFKTWGAIFVTKVQLLTEKNWNIKSTNVAKDKHFIIEFKRYKIKLLQSSLLNLIPLDKTSVALNSEKSI